MIERPTASLIDPAFVHEALDRTRQSQALGDNPLKRLVWLRQRFEGQAAPPSPITLDMELSEALSTLIEGRLVNQRQVVGAPVGEPPDRQSAPEVLQADYSQRNAPLEAWSALYFRYTRVDLDLRWQEMAQALNIHVRQLRRRSELGYRLLAESISRLESEARVANYRLWMRLKLPAPSYSTLFGADAALERTHRWLLDPGPPGALALVGPGGVGKTALAHALARRLIEEDQFEDLAWVSLDTPAGYAALCSLIAGQLDLLHLLQGSLTDLEAGLRARLASTRALVVVDGADALEEPGSLFARLGALVEPGRLLVTMRRQPQAGTPLRVLPLDPLPRPAMDDFLRDIARLRASPKLDRNLTGDALSAIFEAVGGNPLAGRLIAGQMASVPLERALARLGDLQTEDKEMLFDRLFEDAWSSAGEDAQAAAIALLTLPAEGAEWSDVQAVSGLAPDRLDRALETLVGSSMVLVEADGLRYVLPPLARRFAQERSHESPWRETLRGAVAAADRRLHPEPDEPDMPPAANLPQAISLLQQEASLGELPGDLDRQIAEVAPSARRSGQWLAWRDLMRMVIDQLQASGQNQRGLGRALTELGAAYRWLGEHEPARAALDEAVAAFGAAGDFVGQAEALLELGFLCQTLGDRTGAFEVYGRAAEVIGRYQAVSLYRRALNGLAGLALSDAEPAQALKYLQTALAVSGEPPDGQTLSNMGMAYLQLNDSASAIEFEQQALEAFSEEDDLPRQARAHIRLGMALHAAGRPEEALVQLGLALGLMRALGDALGQARALNNLGTVFSTGQRFDEALSAWRDALDLQRQIGDRVGMAYTHFNLADLLWKANQPEPARAALASARELAAELSLPTLSAQIAAHPMSG